MAQKMQGDTPAITIAKGAATVAVTAGVVAAGAILADKQTREKLGKNLGKGMEKVKDVTDKAMKETGEVYPAIQHRIRMTRGSRGKKGKRAAAT